LCRIVQGNDLNQAVTLEQQYNSWIQLDDGIIKKQFPLLGEEIFFSKSLCSNDVWFVLDQQRSTGFV
jgi:hypothetical protein